jgi:hypothetical protein
MAGKLEDLLNLDTHAVSEAAKGIKQATSHMGDLNAEMPKSLNTTDLAEFGRKARERRGR